MIRFGRISTATRGPIQVGYVEDLLTMLPGNQIFVG